MKRTEQREHIFKLIFGADLTKKQNREHRQNCILNRSKAPQKKICSNISEKARKVVEKIE